MSGMLAGNAVFRDLQQMFVMSEENHLALLCESRKDLQSSR